MDEKNSLKNRFQPFGSLRWFETTAHFYLEIGIIAQKNDRNIYLYRIRSQHAGENMEDLLSKRPKGGGFNRRAFEV